MNTGPTSRKRDLAIYPPKPRSSQFPPAPANKNIAQRRYGSSARESRALCSGRIVGRVDQRAARASKHGAGR